MAVSAADMRRRMWMKQSYICILVVKFLLVLVLLFRVSYFVPKSNITLISVLNEILNFVFVPDLKWQLQSSCIHLTIWSKCPVIEAVRIPKDGGSVCCCYVYHVKARLQKCTMHCVLCVIGCVQWFCTYSGAYNVPHSHSCHAELEYPQDGSWGKKLIASIVMTLRIVCNGIHKARYAHSLIQDLMLMEGKFGRGPGWT